jgi:SPP1 gp7 family putative phage head morphogenesis protein
MPVPGAPAPAASAAVLRWLQQRVPMTEAQRDALDEATAAQAFTVAGLTQASVVADVLAAIEAAVRDGTTFDTFRAALRPRVEEAWGKDGGRLSTVFRTTIATAQNAGRYAEATDPDTLALRPFWRFVATQDSRTAPECAAAHGTLLPADDPWWQSHYPPLHHNCRCVVQTLSARQAERLGGPTAPGALPAADGFGSPPT